MVWNKIKKTTKKVFRKTVGAVGKGAVMFAKQRYANPRGLANLASDVMKIKALINVEKKRFDIQSASSDNVLLGQVYQATGSGNFTWDATPKPTSGSGYNQRTGASIKITGANYRFQFTPNGSAPQKVKILLVQCKGISIALTDSTSENSFTPQVLEANPWVLQTDAQYIYDYHSKRNFDKLKDFKVLATKTVSIQPDQLSGQQMIKEFSFNCKFRNNHIKFDKDTATVTAGMIGCIMLCDNGNASNATASVLTAVPITTAGTGIKVRYSARYYYVDN